MKTFCITFSTLGQRDFWVEVTAQSEAIAVAWANREWGRWSMIREKEAFISDGGPELFKLGCTGKTTLAYADARHISPWIPPWAISVGAAARRV